MDGIRSPNSKSHQGAYVVPNGVSGRMAALFRATSH